MNAMHDDGEEGNNPPERHWGMMVAVGVENEEEADQAQHLLQSLGAVDIERAAGTIEDGDWQDFNPISTPHYIEGGARPG
jgi:hypothetical protein